MNERRQNLRYATEQELEAYDSNSALFMGRFVDMSEEGFLLFCPIKIDVDSVWQIRVLAANDLRLRSLLTFGAECLWVRQADESKRYWAGFHIIDITDEDNEKLLSLLAPAE